MNRTILLGAVFLMTSAACSNHLSGDVTVNGTPFAATDCRNGSVFGFTGVEATGKDGTRLRIAATQSGQGNLMVFPPGATVGVDLGACGSFETGAQNSTVNDVKNVRGNAKLAAAFSSGLANVTIVERL